MAALAICAADESPGPAASWAVPWLPKEAYAVRTEAAGGRSSASVDDGEVGPMGDLLRMRTPTDKTARDPQRSGAAETAGGVAQNAASTPDPARVVRLEWRSYRLKRSTGLTSHSMLDAVLLGGDRLRFEKFADTGLLKTRITGGRARMGKVHRGCAATPDDGLLGNFSEMDVSAVARMIGSKPYHLLTANCHHFARDMWNCLVNTPLQTRAIPDELKARLFEQLSKRFGRLPLGGCFMSMSTASTTYLGTQRTNASYDPECGGSEGSA